MTIHSSFLQRSDNRIPTESESDCVRWPDRCYVLMVKSGYNPGMRIEWDPKKAKRTPKDELRAEYKRSDFPKGLVRGKYAERLRESSNIVVLEPEVARAFPNQ